MTYCIAMRCVLAFWVVSPDGIESYMYMYMYIDMYIESRPCSAVQMEMKIRRIESNRIESKLLAGFVRSISSMRSGDVSRLAKLDPHGLSRFYSECRSVGRSVPYSMLCIIILWPPFFIILPVSKWIIVIGTGKGSPAVCVIAKSIPSHLHCLFVQYARYEFS